MAVTDGDETPHAEDGVLNDSEDSAFAKLEGNDFKGVEGTAVTVHATAAFSREFWEADDETVAAALLAAAQLGSSAMAGGTQVQRWRYARPVTVHPERCLVTHTEPWLVFAGDAFGGAKVEGAVLSGRAAAERMAAAVGSG